MTEENEPVTPDMTERYRRAQALLPENLPGLMRNRSVDPRWTGEGDRFWYQRDSGEYVAVDPETFALEVLPEPPALDEPPVPGQLASRDGKVAAFCRDHDLWLSDRATGAERRLTTTGADGFAWGAAPNQFLGMLPIAAAGIPLPPMMTGFSPSGRLLVTARLDERDMTEHPFVDQLPSDRAKPRLWTIRYPHVDETAVVAHELAIIDLATDEVLVIDLPDDVMTALASVGTDVLTWAPDESSIYLFAHEVGAATASIQRIDVRTGERTVVMSETTDDIYEANTHEYSLPLVRVLPASNEVVWFSQRDGWGHLYRYDLVTGACLNQITRGELVVRDILRVDEERRDLLVVVGTEADGGNPYWRRVYRVSLDGDQMTLLTPELADHEVAVPTPGFFSMIFGAPGSSVSPSGRFFVDHMSTVASPPEILLRSAETGAVIGVLERTDISALLAAGYQVPQQFSVTADDGKSRIWGVLTLPPDPVDPLRIPVIDLMYGGYQVVHQPAEFTHGGGDPAAHQLAASFAALGFATVILDGRGTPGRERTFRQWTRGRLDAPRGLEDHVTAIRALAEQHTALDPSRVGVTGHSFGGYNSVRSLLQFPDFFKVAVSSAGVHDAVKMPKGSWNWLLGAEEPKRAEDLRELGNLHLVERLRGKLLLLTGDQDANATLDHTTALMQALIDANKRFDLRIWPGVDHYSGTTPYMRATMWDFFVEHLLGEQVPADLDLR